MSEYMSLTRLAKILSEENNVKITYNMLSKALIANGYITENGDITDRGRKLDICRHIDPENQRQWLVYNYKMKNFLSERIDLIVEKYTPTRKRISSSKSDKKLNTAISIEKNPDCSLYPYLSIPDNFVILDTETTGLENSDVIIELGIVDPYGNTLYQSYFDTEVPINPFAAKCNHLSKKDLAGKPRISTEWPKIKEILKNKCIIGHNIPFDKRLLIQSLESENMDNISEIEELFKDMLDTKVLAQKFISNNSYSLNNLTTLIGITREEQHNAVDDCIMTKEFIDKLEELIAFRIETSFMKV